MDGNVVVANPRALSGARYGDREGCGEYRLWVEFPREIVFTDSDARVKWEQEYPERLREYYAAVSCVARFGPYSSSLVGGGGESCGVVSFRGKSDGGCCSPGNDGEVPSSYREGDTVGVKLSSGCYGDEDEVDERVLTGCSGEPGLSALEVEGVNDAVPTPGRRPGVGPNGGTSHGRGSNYDRNQSARERKKMKGPRVRGGSRANSWNNEKRRAEEVIRSAVPDGVDFVKLGGVVQTGPVSVEKTDLQKSSELKWRTQNELAALKAEREIAILKATDLEEEKRKRRAQICASTERNLVSIEKFHSDLRKSGNTSSDDDTRVNTVLSANAGSISPSSSVSEADVRKAKKDLEDAIAEKNKLAAALTRMGHSPEAIIGYGNAEVGDLDEKTEWTVDSKGRITDDNEAILDVIYPDGYMVIHDDIDFVHPDGKNKVRLVGGPRYSVKESPVEEDVDDDARTHWSLDSRNVLPDKDALKLLKKFPDGYDQNYDCYSDAVTGKRRGVIRPTAYVPRDVKKLNGLS